MVHGVRPPRVADDDEVVFTALVAGVEPQLRRAFVAAYGPDAGREVLADVLAWAWEHLDRVRRLDNPAGYLWRVGRTTARQRLHRARFEVPLREVPGLAAAEVPERDEPLVAALATLTVHQRVAVVLVHGYGYRLAEAADVLGCTVSTLRNHLARGLDHARRQLEGTRP
jgi:DNA-directed RNA polymerase specialized sigma24 family protein